ncbi:hypothetical protein TNCV_2059451 [Trichonephila clavipes]|uniref:Uncharacterized protein n=1 Tax=Trichonephila clavipes TaxID=2585209 RepID=A0A8X6R817_TRICX|nr:hypothetical protein TNCV_2059451 [Trichonephila clavipes]
MSACGREFHTACMLSKSSSFEAAGHGSRARRPPTKLTHAQKATYPENKQAKEEEVGLNRSLEQSLQHVDMQYPAKR